MKNTPNNALELASLRNDLYHNYLLLCSDHNYIPTRNMFELIPSTNDKTTLKQSIRDIKNLYRTKKQPLITKAMQPLTASSSTKCNAIALILMLLTVTIITLLINYSLY